jgi:hypothetical protein
LSELDKTKTIESELISWVFRLHAEMAEKQASYEAESDVTNKRKIARASLATIVSALLEWSVFKEEMVHFPLKDLVQALADLDRGRAHPLFVPLSREGTNISTNAKSELKLWVRAVFSILCEGGFKPKEAYVRIATGLSKNGHTSRKGNPFNWRNVQRWCLEDEVQPVAFIQNQVQQFWSDILIDAERFGLTDSMGKAVLEKELVGRVSDRIWEIPHLGGRYFS